ncbi:hypothetical protein CBM2629_A100084 [Cupriavidus taiwanensis]|nr:hypothetical protein CBM2629_A100084 [Cupriavidus taiwanensis]
MIAMLKGEPSMLDRLRGHLPSDFGLPSIVAHELAFWHWQAHGCATTLNFPFIRPEHEDSSSDRAQAINHALDRLKLDSLFRIPFVRASVAPPVPATLRIVRCAA